MEKRTKVFLFVRNVSLGPAIFKGTSRLNLLIHNLKWYWFKKIQRKYIPIYIQQDVMLHSLFISTNCSTCFGWYLHPSSGAHTTVPTASCISHTVTATCCYHGRDVPSLPW
jgi:hypothetical protein